MGRLACLPTLRTRISCAFLLTSLLGIPCLAQTCSSETDAGIKAYQAAKYEDAVRHFQNALKIDPKLTEARLDLATALAQMYIPGAESSDNLAYAQKSISEYKRVLENNPTPDQRTLALRSLASLTCSTKDFDAARTYNRELLELDRNDTQAYFSIAIADWMQAYQPRTELRESMGLKSTDQLDSVSGCSMLRSMNQAKVEDGIENLTKAIEIRPDHDDAMAYMNLLYREKADYECDDLTTRAADLKTADEWVDRTMAFKKAKAEKTFPSLSEQQ